jgi:pyruvate/2-oxoacid:ferredoxin oxidoreductase alpha subunit/ferredoxin
MSELLQHLSRFLSGFSAARWARASDGQEVQLDALRLLLLAELGATDLVATSIPADVGDVTRRWVATDTDEQSLAHASAAALSGLRATAFVAARGEAAALRRAVVVAEKRRTPFLVVAMWGGQGAHDALQALCGTRALVAVAPTVERAYELALVLRRSAEQALLPAVLFVENARVGFAPARTTLHGHGLSESFLGRADDQITTPTAAQVVSFGNVRRRVPQLFDWDKPRLLSSDTGQTEADATGAAHGLFALRDLPELVQHAHAELSELTGRSEAIVRTVGPEASVCVVCSGVSHALIFDVLDELDTRHGVVMRGVCLDWLEPFPESRVQAALAGAKRVLVLERGEAGATLGVLSQRVLCALSGRAVAVCSVAFGPESEVPPPERLAQLLLAAAHADLPRRLWLGEHVTQEMRSRHPDRTALLEQIRRSYAPPASGVPRVSAVLESDTRCLCVVLRAKEPPSALATSLAERFSEAHRSKAAFCVQGDGAGLWSVLATWGEWAARTCVEGSRAGVLVLLGQAALHVSEHALAVVEGGAVVVPWQKTGSLTLLGLSPALRRYVRRHNLRLLAVEGERDALLHAAMELALGRRALLGGMHDLTQEAERERESVPRHAVLEKSREAPKSEAAFDSLERLWGQVLGPARDGELEPRAPDPTLALPVVSSRSTSLFARQSALKVVPFIDPLRCVACGDCWSACPDSALVPLALTCEALITRAIEGASPEGERTALHRTLTRSAKKLAAYIEQRLASEHRRAIDAQLFAEASEDVLAQANLEAHELSIARDVLSAAQARLLALSPTVSERLFHSPHAMARRPGAVLVWLRDGRACQSCGVCEDACAEGAIAMLPPHGNDLALLQTGASAWEGLPDTPEELRKELESEGVLDPVATGLLRKGALLDLDAVPAGKGAEAGSGVQLALRIVSALASAHASSSRVKQKQRADELGHQLRVLLREQLADALSSPDSALLQSALEGVKSRGDELSEALTALAQKGEHAHLDAPLLARRIETARALEARSAELDPAHGRAAFGHVVGADALKEWLLFPLNPFGVPALISRGEDALHEAESLVRLACTKAAEASRVEALAEQLVQKTELRVLDARDAPVPAISASDVPPLFVWLGSELLDTGGYAGLRAALNSGLPLRIILVDDRDPQCVDLEPTLFALAQGRAFVLSASLAHREHLAAGMHHALTFEGPAFIHLYCPSPGRSNFEPSQLIRMAERAVQARAHPLLRFDPRETDAPLSLEGNPAVDETLLDPCALRVFHALTRLAERTPSAGAFSEPEGRPAYDVAAEVAAHERDAPREELVALEKRLDAERRERLHERLMALAGLAQPRGAGADMLGEAGP